VLALMLVLVLELAVEGQDATTEGRVWCNGKNGYGLPNCWNLQTII